MEGGVGPVWLQMFSGPTNWLQLCIAQGGVPGGAGPGPGLQVIVGGGWPGLDWRLQTLFLGLSD